MTARYTLNYILIHSRAGKGRTNIIETLSDRVDKAAAVISAVLDAEPVTGSVDITPLGPSEFGTAEIGGEVYNVCRLSFSVMEFIN